MSASTNYHVAKRRTPTCDTCKARHQKCDGAQACSNCDLRGIDCTYSSTRRASAISLAKRYQEPISHPSTEGNSRPAISNAQYARLYSRIFDDIVRDLNLDRKQQQGAPPEIGTFVSTQLRNASLPSFYHEARSLIEEQLFHNSGKPLDHSTTVLPPSGQMRSLALEGNLEHGRKMLKDSLPPQQVSLCLLDLFFNYQNSVFFVYTLEQAQAQLALMYKDADQVSIAWFCQMFLIFAVAVQFDDFSDNEGATYYEIGRKYMDDAIEENPQDTIWVVRAMLLCCFYQPSTKWTSIWMYLDAAIRGAQRFQLDVGVNQLKELSDEEYQEWRQVWLTIISFDRWVAIFLGRLPRIKESISRDPIFKAQLVSTSPEYCKLQGHVTILAIILGNILRDMYFSEEFRLSVCRQYTNELDIWMTKLPVPLRLQVQSGTFSDLARDQAEAIFNLHFMLLGARISLLRPLLLKALKSGMSTTGFAGPIASAITSDAATCITYANQLVTSAMTLLSVSLQPKRLFIPILFLIHAVHILVLGAIWKLRQRQEGDLTAPDLTQDFAAIDKATRVLDFCGQRNAFARKHAILVNDLRQQLNKCLGAILSEEPLPQLIVSHNISESSTPYTRSTSLSDVYEMSSISRPMAASSPSAPAGQSTIQSMTTTPLSSDAGIGSDPANPLSVGRDHWFEHFEIFNLAENMSSYDDSVLQDDDRSDFLDSIMNQ